MELIRTRLLEHLRGEVGERIYYQKAADDVALEKNYPQIILSAEKFTDAVHGVSGLLTAEIICSQESKPEPIEKKLRASLEGVFFRGEEIFLLKWQRTELFEEPASERTPLIIGMAVTFAIYEFPSARTVAPDIIEGLESWALELDAVIIGVTDFGEVFEPRRETPAIYFSVEEVRTARQLNAAVFYTAKVRLHLFAPKVRERRAWLSAINNELHFIKAIKLDDGSPARLQGTQYDLRRDEIAGQIEMTLEYGARRRFDYTHGLRRHVSTTKTAADRKSAVAARENMDVFQRGMRSTGS